MSERVMIGVDFGGTKIEVAALDRAGEFRARLRRPNPGSYDLSIRTICELIAEVEAVVGPGGNIGVGLPGSASPRTGLIRNANSVWLNGRDFGADLEAALGRPVRLANDANCLALSEATDGAARGAAVVFAIIVGTGCGGGVAVQGLLLEGMNGIAGECGHIPLPWPQPSETPGPRCWCGQNGCLDTWVSGTGLRRDYRAASGREAAGEEIIEAARSGDKEAAAALARLIDRLGRSMALISNLLDPDVFVLGGGLSNVPELLDGLPAAIRPYVFSEEWEARIVPARWGDSSGVRGAARLWL
jgi:fructokinase